MNRHLRMLMAGGLALGLGTGAAQAQVFPVDTVLNNGPTDRRINLVFLAEGYTAAEMGKFGTDVQNVLNGLFNVTPYRQYQSLFNAYAVQVPSNESGTDHPGTANDEPGGLSVFFHDTYFNSTFDAADVHRALVADASQVYLVLQNNFPEWDAAFVVVNTSWYGGTGGSYSTFSTHSAAAEIAIHELGHSYAKLADEYDYGGWQGREAPNTTAETDRAQIRWNVWIEPTTPIPTPEIATYSAVVGLFEGAVYNPVGWYRPKLSCKMQSLGIPFCEVCSEQTIVTTYSLLSPIDGVDPDVPSVTVDWQSSVTLSVAPLQIVPNTIFMEWYVDGSLVASGNSSLLFDAGTYDTGQHIVDVYVTDTTDMVRKDPSSLLTAFNTWTVEAQPPPYKIGDANFDGVVTSADAIFLVDHVFRDGPPPSPFEIAGDLDCSGTITSVDILLLVNYMFRGGPPPPLDCP